MTCLLNSRPGQHLAIQPQPSAEPVAWTAVLNDGHHHHRAS
jgi:Beta-lactamase